VPDPLPDNLMTRSGQAKGSASSRVTQQPFLTATLRGMTLGLILLQTEAHRELPIPAWAFGVLGFGILLALLLITWSIGKGRPHS
jgi:hypothetical protein